jgi:uncharacterized protein (TIGR01777 family)
VHSIHLDSAPLHVALTGASGLIGSTLSRRLSLEGHRVSALVRREPEAGEIGWDPEQGRLAPRDLEGVTAVVHLAGENIGARWTSARKARIRSSRLLGTRLLSETLAQLRTQPATLLSASAVGIYGNRGDEILTESSPPGDPEDFLVSLAQEWEAAAEPARVAGIRVVHPRFGLVLSPAGGALGKMLLPFRLGLGGRLGSGAQWMSWIALDDAVSAIIHLLRSESVHGPVNVTAPVPLRNRDFTRTLGDTLSRPTPFPVPAAALRLVFGRMADGTLLASTRVVPQRLAGSGFRFAHPELDSALRHMLQEKR